jgi:hypothetical protein
MTTIPLAVVFVNKEAIADSCDRLPTGTLPQLVKRFLKSRGGWRRRILLCERTGKAAVVSQIA